MLHGRRAGRRPQPPRRRPQGLRRSVPVAFEGVLLEQVAVGIYGGLEHGRTGSQRRFRRGHDREGLIFDFDQMGGLAGGEAVAGHDHGHFVAVIADVLGQQKAVGHVSVRRVHGVGMSGCGKEEARHVIGGEDGLDAGQGQRFRGIDGKDHAVGDGAVHIGGVPHTRQAISSVYRAAPSLWLRHPAVVWIVRLPCRFSCSSGVKWFACGVVYAVGTFLSTGQWRMPLRM